MERLAALRAYDILDTASEQAFDDLVAVAAEITGSPIALISLIDEDRQWFKARIGLDAEETQRELAFCGHAILAPDAPLSVPDATRDPRFADNPLVTGAPDIRSYLGVPLVTPEGLALGTLCVIDRVPREHDAKMVDAMQRLARAAAAQLELRRSLRGLRDAAATDPLTELPNRRGLLLRLESMLKRGDPVAVLALDLDHLKEANDVHGHEAGDALIRAVAWRLRASLRGCDCASRVGGDEFVVVLANVGTAQAAGKVGERLAGVLARPVPFGHAVLRNGVTVGAALSSIVGTEPACLLRSANEALLRAKRAGRGSQAFARPEDVERADRAARVARALTEPRDGGPLPGLRPFFQPVLELRSGAVAAVEVLARWHHPELGQVSPVEMFAAAERVDMATRLSAEVRVQAFAAFARLRREGLAPPRIAINLSASELLEGTVLPAVEANAEAAGLDPAALCIEITEDALLERLGSPMQDRLAALRGRGAQIALDDFGTGSSGLAQLLAVPLDAIKLDRTFVARLGTDSRAERIVEGAIRLAHSMGLSVTAEGIEQESQRRRLLQLRCDAGQGFLLARPMDEAALCDWLRARPAPRTVLPLRAASGD